MSAPGETPGAIDDAPLPDTIRRQLDNCASCWVRRKGDEVQRSKRTAWFVAVACLTLAVVAWWPRLGGSIPRDGVASGGQLAAGLSREQLLATGGEQLRRWPWAPAGSVSPGVAGDVVWDGAKQAGYLRFTGLDANDPARHRYQLWIVDGGRDERYPVDGGIFDVSPASGEVIVPIRAALPVRDPAAFVVTLEKPDGAVVSGREIVVAVARPRGG